MEQVNIEKMTIEELWKLAFEQQKSLTGLLVQMQQIQMNITLIEAEINKRQSV